MSRLLKVLRWDSEFFGMPIGRVLPSRLDDATAKQLLEQARATGLACLYFQVDGADSETVATVERLHFRLVDVRTELEHTLGKTKDGSIVGATADDMTLGPPRVEELPRLRQISAQIGRLSRFAVDPGFGPEACRRLYFAWIEKACAGSADVVLVAREGQETMGLISCSLSDGVGRIDLAGVDDRHRRKTVGSTLVRASLDWAEQRGATGMRVVTQARNVPAQRLYQRMGFLTRTMDLFYHKWL